MYLYDGYTEACGFEMDMMKLTEGLHVIAQTVCCLVLLHGKNIELDNAMHSIMDDRHYNISSPGFPKCCKLVNMKYLLRKTKNVMHLKYWKLFFTDLDLPPGSQLVIYGLKIPGGQKEEIDKARYQSGAWIRPTIVYDGYAISIEFYLNENYVMDESITFVGFKGTYWLSEDSWQLERPLTDCPPIGNLMQGGSLTVTSSEIPLGAQHNTLHCIWQLKPLPHSYLPIFITIKYLHDGYYITIHNGLSSSSPILFTATKVDNHSNSPTFTSKEGFYIQLVKPIDKGGFSMTYGVTKALSTGNNQCEFKTHSRSVIGFTCEEDEQNICIPLQKKCDGINDCPTGSDEMPGTCGAPIPIDDKLPDATGHCQLGKCKDGRCPQSVHEKCPEDDCAPRRRRCPGTLLCVIDKYESCPSELNTPLRYFFIGMSLILILGCLCCMYYRYRQKHKRQTSTSVETNHGLRFSLITFFCCNRTAQLNDAAFVLNDVTTVLPEVSNYGNSYPCADFPVVDGPNGFSVLHDFGAGMTSHSSAATLPEHLNESGLTALPSYADTMASQAMIDPSDFHSNHATTVEATEINGDSVPPTYDDVMNDTITSPHLEVMEIPESESLPAPPAYDDVVAGLSMIITDPEPPPPYSAQAETVI